MDDIRDVCRSRRMDFGGWIAHGWVCAAGYHYNRFFLYRAFLLPVFLPAWRNIYGPVKAQNIEDQKAGGKLRRLPAMYFKVRYGYTHVRV
ncbi:hypothetical protein SDC9_191709 [bioreactor metagenome]|uniref:Uncharacterized protein n=1 Tax=bioreactor metagenome TaxID=1076179 RepID=A0A645HYS1_9ZZZZ